MSQTPKKYIVFYERFDQDPLYSDIVYTELVEATSPDEAVDKVADMLYHDPLVDIYGAEEYVEKPVNETFLSRKDPVVDIKELLYERLSQLEQIDNLSFHEGLLLHMKMGSEAKFLRNILDIIERS